jgi:hypothetical protein
VSGETGWGVTTETWTLVEQDFRTHEEEGNRVCKGRYRRG